MDHVTLFIEWNFQYYIDTASACDYTENLFSLGQAL